MFTFFIMFFMITAKAKEETGIGRRTFQYGMPDDIIQQIMEQLVIDKVYHDSEGVMSFEKYYNRKLEEERHRIESWSNIGQLYQDWKSSEHPNGEPFLRFYKNKIAEQKGQLSNDTNRQVLLKQWQFYKDVDDRLQEVRKHTVLEIDTDIRAIDDCRKYLPDSDVVTQTQSLWTKYVENRWNEIPTDVFWKIALTNAIYYEWARADFSFDYFKNKMSSNDRLRGLSSEAMHDVWLKAKEEPNFPKYFKETYESMKSAAQDVTADVAMYRQFRHYAFHDGMFVRCYEYSSHSKIGHTSLAGLEDYIVVYEKGIWIDPEHDGVKLGYVYKNNGKTT